MENLSVLGLQRVVRPQQPGKPYREFLDITIDGISLWQLCKLESLDEISCLWLPKPNPLNVKRLLLQAPADFADGSRSLYVCSICGEDLGCGAVSVQIQVEHDVFTWRDFIWQTNYGSSWLLPAFDGISPVYFDFNQYTETLSEVI